MNDAPDSTPDEAAETAKPTSRIGAALVRYKWVLFFAALIWFGLLLGGGIVLSTVDARAGLHIFGTKTWVAGETAVLRVGLKDLEYGMRRPLKSVNVQLSRPDGSEGPKYILREQVGKFVQGVVKVPALAGEWRAEFRTKEVDTPFLAEVTVNVLARQAPPPLPQGRFTGKKRGVDTGPVRLDLRPLDGSLPAELPSRFVLTAHSDGNPVAAQVNLEIGRGKSKRPLPRNIEIPKTGFFTIPVQSIRPAWEVNLRSDQSSTSREITPASTQFTIEVPAANIQTGLLKFSVRSIFATGDAFVDLWWGERWLSATGVTLEDGQGEGVIEIPTSLRPGAKVWLRVYRNAYLPGENRGGRHLLIDGPDTAALTTALTREMTGRGYGPRALLEAAAEVSGEGQEGLRFLLGRLSWPEREPPLLADSGETVIQTVSELKRVWQTRFVWALLLSGVVLFLVILVLFLYKI